MARPDYPVNPTPNFSINFNVKVSDKDAIRPQVEVQLKGADEVLDMTSLLEEGRYLQFRGNGKITQVGSDIIWKPLALNATLSYQAVVPHVRKPGVFDSYGKRDWVITRTDDLFPRKRFQYRKSAKSLTTVTFDLPETWSVVTAMPRVSEHVFRAYRDPESSYDRPSGWLIYGKVKTSVIGAKDARITLAYPEAFVRPAKGKDPGRIQRRQKYLDWFNNKIKNIEDIFGKVMPIMTDFMPEYARTFLIVMGKSPMWQGGLSGDRSLFINRGVPNIASDHTSTLIHEYFHVCDGFTKDPRDSEWFVEGLAEFFSLRLLYDAGLIKKSEFHDGIEKLKAAGIWGVNLTRTHKRKVLYKNAPVVIFVLDEMIREKSQGKKSLRDVMPLLAAEEKPVNTALFIKKVETVYGEPLKVFVNAYVYGGKVPGYKKYLK